MFDSQKGFAQVFVLLFLLLTIPVGLYLVQHPAIFKPRADQATAVYNVKTFGAKGDGVSDDTVAIQQAINSAIVSSGSVYLPAGRYKSGALGVDSNITIYGDPNYASIITLKDETRNHLFSPKNYQTATTNNVHIRDLKLLGNSEKQYGGGPITDGYGTGTKHAVAIFSGSNWRVERVWAEDFDGDGVYIGRGSPFSGFSYTNQHNTIINCVVRRNVRNGMMIAVGQYNTIKDSLFEENQIGMLPSSPKYAPQIYESAELDLEPNVAGEYVDFNTIEGNTFKNGNNVGIQMTRPGPNRGVRGNIIRNNTLIDNKRVQLKLISEVATDNIIVGNKFSYTTANFPGTHVRISLGSRNRLENNQFQGGSNAINNSRPIQIDGSLTGTIIQNNKIDFTGGSPGDGQSVFITSTATNTTWYGNTLTNAKLDARSSVITTPAGPLPTATPTPSPTPSRTPRATPTATPVINRTPVPTQTATATPRFSPTPTPTPRLTNTLDPGATPTPTYSSTQITTTMPTPTPGLTSSPNSTLLPSRNLLTVSETETSLGDNVGEVKEKDKKDKKDVPIEEVGDLNGDGKISPGDIIYFISKWNTDDPIADLNNDGKVNGGDISFLRPYFRIR